MQCLKFIRYMILLVILVLNVMTHLWLNSTLKKKLILIILLLVMSPLVFSVILSILVLLNLCMVISVLLLIFIQHKTLYLILCKHLNSYLQLFVNDLIMILLNCLNFWKRRKIVEKQSNWVLFRNTMTPILLQALIQVLTIKLEKVVNPSSPKETL